jgi:RNA polymerase sigma factor (sigma-70 family)
MFPKPRLRFPGESATTPPRSRTTRFHAAAIRRARIVLDCAGAPHRASLRPGSVRMNDSPITEHTTRSLLQRIRIGDMRARADLVARIEPLLRRFARGRVPALLRGQEDTADLVQLTWLKVLDRLDSIDTREPGAFFAYLRATLINALREALRRQARSPIVPVSPSGGMDEANALSKDVAPEDWLAWEQALAGLEPAQRGVVLMRFEFGMSFVEIAQELGQTTDGVRMKFNRAIARMAGAAHADAG